LCARGNEIHEILDLVEAFRREGFDLIDQRLSIGHTRCSRQEPVNSNKNNLRVPKKNLKRKPEAVVATLARSMNFLISRGPIQTPLQSCVRFATTVASGHATLATKRTLLLIWAGLAPAG
jgi:hypothetical protein